MLQTGVSAVILLAFLVSLVRVTRMKRELVQAVEEAKTLRVVIVALEDEGYLLRKRLGEAHARI